MSLPLPTHDTPRPRRVFIKPRFMNLPLPAYENPNLLRVLARQAVEIAREEIGNGETLSNNVGPAVERYRGGPGAGSWCAHFVSWCFEEACRRRTIPLPFKRSGGAKRLVRNVAKVGRNVGSDEWPAMGDVIAWHRGRVISWQGHVEIISGYAPESDTLLTVAGNRGSFPSVVEPVTYPRGLWRKRLYGIARLA